MSFPTILAGIRTLLVVMSPEKQTFYVSLQHRGCANETLTSDLFTNVTFSKTFMIIDELTLQLRVLSGVPPLPRVPRPLLRRQLVHLADHLLATLVPDRQQVQQELLRQVLANLCEHWSE